MTEEQVKRIVEILEKGGSLVMHRDDAARLKESSIAGNRPGLFDGVKITVDKTGLVAEGQIVAAVIGGESSEFGFRSSLEHLAALARRQG